MILFYEFNKYRCIGPKARAKVCCAICCLIVIGCIVLAWPVIIGNLVTLPLTRYSTEVTNENETKNN